MREKRKIPAHEAVLQAVDDEDAPVYEPEDVEVDPEGVNVKKMRFPALN